MNKKYQGYDLTRASPVLPSPCSREKLMDLTSLKTKVYSINHHLSCQPGHASNTFHLNHSLLIPNSRDDSTPAPHQHIRCSRRGQREEKEQNLGGQQITGVELPSPPVYFLILPQKTPPGKHKCAEIVSHTTNPNCRRIWGLSKTVGKKKIGKPWPIIAICDSVSWDGVIMEGEVFTSDWLGGIPSSLAEFLDVFKILLWSDKHILISLTYL